MRARHVAVAVWMPLVSPHITIAQPQPQDATVPASSGKRFRIVAIL